MKRILILNYEFPPLGGGAANATYFLLKEFAMISDLEIDLVTSSAGGFQIEQFSKNIQIHYLDIGKQGNLHYQSQWELLKYSWRAYWYSKKLIKNKKIDLVHAFFGIPCGFIAWGLGLPYIVSLRGSDVPFYNDRFYWLDRLVFQRLSRRIWKKASKVIANSKGLKELALKTSSKQTVEIIHNGVDISEYHPVEKKEKDFTIISTSRLTARKGIKYLIEAFLEFNQRHIESKLILVGDGDQVEELKDLAKNNQAIIFLGPVSKAEMPEKYNQADVFVSASLNEGMSNSILEAMASGLAIIATDTGGSNELILDNGVVVEKKNSQAICDALEILYTDRIKLDQMKKASRAKAEIMSWERVAQRYFEIYKGY